MSVDPTSSTVDCGELARMLDAYLDGELAPLEQGEADAHLASCERCRAGADAERRVRAALRAQLRAAMGPAGPAGLAPDALRARIGQALARERKPLWRRALQPLPLGALAACAAGVLVVFVTHGGMEPLAEEAVSRHTRDLPLEVSAASIGPEAVAGWFAGKLDFNAAPPRFRADGVRLLGGRLSHIQDRPAAYVRYELPHGHLGLFIVADPDRHFGDVSSLLGLSPAAVRVLHARGYNVAVWRKDEIVYSLVSDVGADDLARLVETARAAR
ncbi:MAG TPA: zf-HC2 domain-containing protein [Anaeromyxobacteraceae bacterium]|nr:zf-HC2 domain-containing protein [Anaeromyxobacteraceae bacterium]